MLIIPAENAINWKRPPWVTLGLIMACLLVFLFYQGGDSRKLEQAVEQYLAADLYELEAPAYEDYLQRQIQFQGEESRVYELQQFQQLRQENENFWLAINLMMDREFYQYLLQNRDVIWAPAERAHWQEQREHHQWIRCWSRCVSSESGILTVRHRWHGHVHTRLSACRGADEAQP